MGLGVSMSDLRKAAEAAPIDAEMKEEKNT